MEHLIKASVSLETESNVEVFNHELEIRQAAS